MFDTSWIADLDADSACHAITGNQLDLREQERLSIERALERFGGNRRNAAAALKISTVTLWRKMKRYGLSA